MGTWVRVSAGLSKPGHLLSILRAHLHVVGGEDAHAAVVLALQPVPVHLLVDVDDVPLLQCQLPGGTPTCPQPHCTPWVPIHHPRDCGDTVGTPSITVTYLGDSAWKSNLRRAAFIWGGRGAVMGGSPHIPDPPHPGLTFFSSLLTASAGSPMSDRLGRVPGLRVSAKRAGHWAAGGGAGGGTVWGGSHLCQGPPGSGRWPAPAPPASCWGWRVGGGCRGGSAAGGVTEASCGVTVAQPSAAATLPLPSPLSTPLPPGPWDRDPRGLPAVSPRVSPGLSRAGRGQSFPARPGCRGAGSRSRRAPRGGLANG